MIRNVIFDMGNVLINFDPAHFIRRAGITDPQDAQMLLRKVELCPAEIRGAKLLVLQPVIRQQCGGTRLFWPHIRKSSKCGQR